MKKTFVILLVVLCFFIGVDLVLAAEGTVSSTHKYAWSNQIGWINFAPTNDSGVYVGLNITDTVVTGYAWSQNLGWINFSPTNSGVANTSGGTLSGYAWGENTGWINFTGVTITPLGRFGGTATGDVVGTINFDCTNCNVSTNWLPQGGGGGYGGGLTGITVNKTTVGGDGTFNFITTGSGYANFSIVTSEGSGSNTQTNLAPGTYSVIENVPLGWIKTQDTCSSITVVGGQIATCSITNTFGNSVPTITSITPSYVIVGSPQFTLTVNGTNFVSSSVVKWNGSNRTTTYVSGTRLTATIPSTDLAGVGTFNVTVNNPAFGGTSNSVVFTVNNLVPSITTISPPSKTVGDLDFTLTVNGANFIPSSTINIQGLATTTTYVSSTKLTTFISPVPSAGTYNITVVNPSPGGGTSNEMVFVVQGAPVSSGSITVNKITLGGDGVFNFVATGAGYSNFSITTSGGSGSNTQTNLASGTYSVIENVPQGWDKTQDTCSFITVVAGQNTTCSVTNTKVESVVPPVPPIPPISLSPVNLPGPIGDNAVVVAANVIKEIKKIIETPEGSIVTKIISTAGVISGVVVTAFVITSSSFSLYEIFLMALRFFSVVLTAFGMKKRVSRWGVVYDSVTKQPLDPAYVILKDLEGRQIAYTITDIDGRYGFFAEIGAYTLQAQKTHYTFPSQKLSGRTSDELYNNLYFGQAIEINTTGQVIVENIPLDPVQFDWNEFAKKNKTFMKFYSHWDLALRKFFDALFVIGFVVAIISFIFAPYPYNTMILALYLVLLLLRILGLKPKSFGYIIDKATGIPLSFAILRIVMASSNIEISRKVADAYGRYYCLIPKGKYYVKIEKKNSDGSYTLIHTSPMIDASREGIIRKKFEI